MIPAQHNIKNEALGFGMEFPIRIDQAGGLAVVTDEEKVRQSILAILSTAKGERVMRPDFGCDIHSFVFAILDTSNLTMIKSAVRGALVRWEPRIDVGEIDLTVAGDGNRVEINVHYTIRITNFSANLVYPFYLQTGI